MIRTYNWSLLSIRLAHTDTAFFLWKDDGDRNSNADTAASIADVKDEGLLQVEFFSPLRFTTQGISIQISKHNFHANILETSRHCFNAHLLVLASESLTARRCLSGNHPGQAVAVLEWEIMVIWYDVIYDVIYVKFQGNQRKWGLLPVAKYSCNFIHIFIICPHFSTLRTNIVMDCDGLWWIVGLGHELY